MCFHVAHDGADVYAAEARPEQRAGSQLVRLVAQDVPLAEVRVGGATGHRRVFPADDVGAEEGLALDLVVLCLDNITRGCVRSLREGPRGGPAYLELLVLFVSVFEGVL